MFCINLQLLMVKEAYRTGELIKYIYYVILHKITLTHSRARILHAVADGVHYTESMRIRFGIYIYDMIN